MRRSLIFKITIVMLLILTALSLVAGCATPAVPQGQPGPSGPPVTPAPSIGSTLLVMPNPVKVGQAFNIAGSGFQPGSVVTLTLVGVEYQKLEFVFEYANVNTYGAFNQAIAKDATTTIGQILKPGVYTVKAEDNKGGIATTPFILAAAQ